MVFEILLSPGVLKRAGLSGSAMGFDWPSVFALTDAAGIERSVAAALFQTVEPIVLSELSKRESDGK